MSTPRCDMSLGEILIHMGALSHAALEAARDEQRRRAEQGTRTLIGELLVRRGDITRAQLNEALEKQRKIRKSPSAAVAVVLELANRRTDVLGLRLAAVGGR